MDEDPRVSAGIEPDRLDPADIWMLYERHRLPDYRYLRARTSSDDDALDLAGITFEKAFANLGRFRSRDGGVQAWLFRIARNAAIDAHRRQRPTVVLEAADAQLGRAALEAGRRDDERTDILDLVGRLPEDQREALLLRYAGGLTAKEIGIVVGKREGAVQKQIERGLAALRETLR